MKKSFPLISDLSNCLEKTVTLVANDQFYINNSLKIRSKGFNYDFKSIYVEKKERLSIKLFEKTFNHYWYSYDVFEEKISTELMSKKIRSMLIDQINTLSLSFVVHSCKSHAINIYTSDSCFYCTLKDVELIRKFYFSGLKTIFLEGDILKQFIENNLKVQNEEIILIKDRFSDINEKIRNILNHSIFS